MKSGKGWFALCILSSLLAFSALADRSVQDEARDRATYRATTAPWEEIQPTLPAPPLKADLRPLWTLLAAPGYRYFIDTASLSVATDRVVRYTIVMVSPSGSRSGFFEGLRCASDEIKTYGYLGGDGRIRWRSRVRWQALTAHSQGVYGYRQQLAEMYLCDGAAVHSLSRIAAALARYRPSGVWHDERGEGTGSER